MKTLPLVLVTLLSGILVGVYFSTHFSTITFEQDIRFTGNQTGYSEIPQLSLDDYTKVDIKVDYGNIYLISGCRLIAMTTNPVQTNSIQKGLEGSLDFRPTTHDVIKNILKTYETEVLMVKITEFEYDTYFAKIILKRGDKILNLDSRPSDAIAIAVRTNADIYVNNNILSSQGMDFC